MGRSALTVQLSMLSMQGVGAVHKGGGQMLGEFAGAAKSAHDPRLDGASGLGGVLDNQVA